MQTSLSPKLLLLAGSGDGPWTATRYSLFAGSPEKGGQPLLTTRISAASLSHLEPVGQVISTALGRFDAVTCGEEEQREATRSFYFPADSLPARTLYLHECGYAAGGVGHQVWASAIVLALFLRSYLGGMQLLGSQLAHRPKLGSKRVHGAHPPRRVLELGAGLGLPGLELATRGDHVTVTDSRDGLLAQLRREALGAAAELDSCGGLLEVRRLDWLNEADVAAAAGRPFDLVIGADICYTGTDLEVKQLAAAINRLGAPLTLLAAPAGRTTFVELKAALESEDAFELSETLYTLTSADAQVEKQAELSAASYRILALRRRQPAISPAAARESRAS